MDILVEIVDRLFKNATCSFKDTYALYCPACGMTRALKYALRFEFINSLKSNPMIFILLVNLIVTIALRIWRIKTSKKAYIAKDIMLINIITLIIWIAFGVIRNLLLVYCGIDFLGDLSNYT